MKVQLYPGTCTPLTHMQEHTTLLPAAGCWLSCFLPRGPPSMRDTCVYLTNYAPYTSLPRVQPFFLSCSLIRREMWQFHLSPYIKPSLHTSLCWRPSLLAPCLSPRKRRLTPALSPRPLTSPLGNMWRKGPGFVSLSSHWHQPQGKRT